MAFDHLADHHGHRDRGQEADHEESSLPEATGANTAASCEHFRSPGSATETGPEPRTRRATRLVECERYRWNQAVPSIELTR